LRPTYETLSDADKALVKSALAGETQADALSTDKNYIADITDTAGHQNTIGFSAADVYEATKTYNETYFAVLDSHLVDQTDNVVKEITGIGIRYSFLENNLQRLELEEMTLGEMQHQIEGIDEIEEDNNLQMNKLAWTLTLQYGSQYLPQTLMDYIA
jgi:flagellin-like hook-associated protein FlgL